LAISRWSSTPTKSQDRCGCRMGKWGILIVGGEVAVALMS